MHRNYCFRRKRHSYAACDAALAASIYSSSPNTMTGSKTRRVFFAKIDGFLAIH